MASKNATLMSDPLGRVASAAQSAATAVSSGASQVVEKAQQAIPATSQFLSKSAYHGGYYLAYGLVFPTLFLARVIPGGNSLLNGMADGATAAGKALHQLAGKGGAVNASAPASKPKSRAAKKPASRRRKAPSAE
ncbi:MAG: hypothetical protein ACKV0T_16930 [Planctomycetales bacterium]